MKLNGQKKVLIITTWFPNEIEPAKCVFTKKIIEAQYEYTNIIFTIISPIPSFPFLNLKFIPKKYKRYLTLKYSEITAAYTIFRPKYIKLQGSLSNKIDWYNYYKTVLKTIKKEDIEFDIIHSHGLFPDAYVATLISKRFNKPVVVHLHDSFFVENVYTNHKNKIISTLKNANKIIPVSQFQAQTLINAIKLDIKEKIAVVYNGVDLKTFHNITHTTLKSSNRIIFIGDDFNRKGLNVLLNAIALIKDTFKLELDVFGNGNSKDYIALAKQLNIEKMINFKGSVSNTTLSILIPNYTLLVLPSKHETFGIALIEAMACGVPVISTNITAIPEVVSNEDVGILVPPDNPAILSKAIEKAFTKQWDHSFIHEYSKRFSIKETAVKINDIYDDVLK
jgi:glycosyltransferase involved in cell wall biosynthesis